MHRSTLVPADGFDLAPGIPATFAIVRGAVSSDSIRNMLVVRPEDLVAAGVHGHIVARDGAAPANARVLGQVLVADGDFDALRRRDDVWQSV